MKAAIARMFMKIDKVNNPKMIENYKEHVDEMLNGAWNHIIKPALRIAKWTVIAFVAVNLLMLVFGESRFIDDWSVMDRLRYEWKALRWLIDRQIL